MCPGGGGHSGDGDDSDNGDGDNGGDSDSNVMRQQGVMETKWG